MCGIFVVITHVIVPQFAIQIIAGVMKCHIDGLIIEFFLYDSFAIVLIECFYIYAELGQINGFDCEAQHASVLRRESTAQTRNLCNIQREAHMKKKLVSGFEFVGIGGERTACVLVITQHIVAYEPTNKLLAEALEVYALGDSFEEVLSKCHGLSSLACACYYITKSSTNFSAYSSAFRCLIGVVVHNAHGY